LKKDKSVSQWFKANRWWCKICNQTLWMALLELQPRYSSLLLVNLGGWR